MTFSIDQTMKISRKCRKQGKLANASPAIEVLQIERNTVAAELAEAQTTILELKARMHTAR